MTRTLILRLVVIALIGSAAIGCAQCPAVATAARHPSGYHGSDLGANRYAVDEAVGTIQDAAAPAAVRFLNHAGRSHGAVTHGADAPADRDDAADPAASPDLRHPCSVCGVAPPQTAARPPVGIADPGDSLYRFAVPDPPLDRTDRPPRRLT